MKFNISNQGRIIRLFLAALSAFLWGQHIIYGWLAYTGILVTVILLITSFIGFCPLYKILGINSNFHETRDTGYTSGNT